jgi:hypothetical protein
MIKTFNNLVWQCWQLIMFSGVLMLGWGAPPPALPNSSGVLSHTLLPPYWGDSARGVTMEGRTEPPMGAGPATTPSWPHPPGLCSWHDQPSSHSVIAHFLELYHECMDNCGWAKVLYKPRGDIETQTFSSKVRLAASVTTTPDHHHASLDEDQPARGGALAIRGGGRPGQRGCLLLSAQPPSTSRR